MPKAVGKNQAKAPYFTNWKVLWKRRSLRIILRFLMEELQSNPVQDSIHELIIWKVNPFVASVTWSRIFYAMFSIRWNGKYFNRWNFYLDILQTQENRAGRNFITNSLVYSLLLRKQKCRLRDQQQLTDGGILANRNSANYPYCFLCNQKKVQILALLHVICERNVSFPHPENRLQK